MADFQGSLHIIQKLVFKEEIINRDIFRIQASARTQRIFISEKLKILLEQEKISGYELTPLPEYKET